MTPTATVPRHWESGNIRRFARMKSGHTPSRSVPAYWENTDIPWFTLADVWQLRDGKQIYLGDTANKINELGLANSAAELLPAGTVLLSRTASVGFSGIMPRPMATSQDFWNWVCGPELLPEYLNYQFKSMTAEFKSLNMGSTHQTIYQKDAATLQIVVPPLDEQRAIANYLDRETARIDTLIEEQQRLIELLRERRASEIASEFAEAATTPLRQVIEYAQTGPFGTQLTADEYVDCGVPVINPTHIRRGLIVPDESITVTPEKAQDLARYRLAVGDIVLGRKGEVDKSALVDKRSAGYVCGSDAMALRPAAGTVPDYLWWFLQSTEAHSQLEFWSVGATVSGLNQTTIRKVRLPLPDEQEQRRIVSRLYEKTAKIDALIAETVLFIELSKERRSALITAAVTGQIDVREKV
ncbi:restriction endonuclease subunit S [Nocardia arizonensis]|uniref:restriction endonuclease subunit S n=1 Tax=Nocardia arizonensis TaxID=1141647 RepID=UPI000A9DB847|nr:restriction endonuclease subunit S [Nocardia arizonensis]